MSTPRAAASAPRVLRAVPDWDEPPVAAGEAERLRAEVTRLRSDLHKVRERANLDALALRWAEAQLAVFAACGLTADPRGRCVTERTAQGVKVHRPPAD